MKKNPVNSKQLNLAPLSEGKSKKHREYRIFMCHALYTTFVKFFSPIGINSATETYTKSTDNIYNILRRLFEVRIKHIAHKKCKKNLICNCRYFNYILDDFDNDKRINTTTPLRIGFLTQSTTLPSLQRWSVPIADYVLFFNFFFIRLHRVQFNQILGVGGSQHNCFVSVVYRNDSFFYVDWRRRSCLRLEKKKSNRGWAWWKKKRKKWLDKAVQLG